MRAQGIECCIVKPNWRLLQYRGAWKNTLLNRILTGASVIQYNIKLLSLAIKKEIDVIYCNCARSVLYICLARFYGIPIMWYIKGELTNKILDRVCFVFANKIYFQCISNLKDKYPLLIKFFKGKIGVLKMGVDLTEFMTVPLVDGSFKNQIKYDSNKINIAMIGQVYFNKAVHIAIEAISLIKKRYPDITLYIIGDLITAKKDGYLNYLQNIIKQRKIEESIKLLGWRNDVLRIISLTDIIIHPSFTEGFPNAVMEAMGMAKPVIATKTGGLRELIVDGEDGYLVEINNPAEIAERLITLIENEHLRSSFSQKAKKKIFSEYGIQNMVENIGNIWINMAKKQLKFRTPVDDRSRGKH